MRESCILFLIFACAFFACTSAGDETKGNDVPDGMTLIPAGSFIMGSNDGFDNEKPPHEVYIDAFYMDIHEVTVAQFKQFVDATGYKADSEKEGKQDEDTWRHDTDGKLIDRDRMNHPVINVSWNEAQAYAKWAGKRLPTEAEWEYAARSGSKGYKYSWGNGDPVGKKGDNLGWPSYDDGYRYTAPVGSFEPNEFGLFDMTGNVMEWCADWYDPSYYAISPKQNPKGPESGAMRVSRGGSWLGVPDSRCAFRSGDKPAERASYVGFRCAQDIR